MNNEESLRRHLKILSDRGSRGPLRSINVLISGMQGLGVEIAKNVIQRDVVIVTLHDEGKVEQWDLSGSFIFTENDCGKFRVLVAYDKLRHLNPRVEIFTLFCPLREEMLSLFQVVVMANHSLEKAIEINDYCRTRTPPIPFISAEVRGVFGQVFCDFGPQFSVTDLDGMAPKTAIVKSISNFNPCVVCCLSDDELEFEEDDLVYFSEVEGMKELNYMDPRKVKSPFATSFIIEEDTSNYGRYIKGGVVTQVKPSIDLPFKPLREAIEDPGKLFSSNPLLYDRTYLLNLAFQALDKFLCKLRRFPTAGHPGDLWFFRTLVDSLNLQEKKITEDDEHVFRQFTFGASAVLIPMASIFGGIVGEEIFKASTAKFCPFFQFLYFDSVESIPSLTFDVRQLHQRNTRYDAQISVMGFSLQEKMANAKVFVVGCGSLGSELIKNLAVMGVGCGKSGEITISDTTMLETKHLCRSPFFRRSLLGEKKTTVAVKGVSLIDPSIKIQVMSFPVSGPLNRAYDRSFWSQFNAVISAVDTCSSKVYINGICRYFRRTLFEVDTCDVSCITYINFDDFGRSFGPSDIPKRCDPSDSAVQFFPSTIDHCLIWGLSEFMYFFHEIPMETHEYITHPHTHFEIIKTRLGEMAKKYFKSILKCMEQSRKDYLDCVVSARNMFEEYFVKSIQRVALEYPANAVGADGNPIWNPPKRFPQPLKFCTKEKEHLNFIMAWARMIGELYGIDCPSWGIEPQKVADIVNAIFVYSRSGGTEDSETVQSLREKMNKAQQKLGSDFLLVPVQYGKEIYQDLDVEVIAGLTNLRAKSYGIHPISRRKVKLFVDNYLPANTTAIAIGAGLVCLELYKVLDGYCQVYKNHWFDLRIPCCYSEIVDLYE